MADIETLGTSPGAVILSIGAIVFDPGRPWDILSGQPEATDPFHVGISMESCLDAGLVMEPGTIRFWMSQDDASREEAFSGKTPLAEALSAFSDWFQNKGGRRLWAHGASFDPPILAAAYEACGMQPPWEFRQLRDTRTAFDLAGIEYSGKAHKPVQDCMAQAEKVCEAYGVLGRHRATDQKPSDIARRISSKDSQPPHC